MPRGHSTQQRQKSKKNRVDKSHLKPYLLFDAGGTLVFPDQPFLIKKARENGIELASEQLFNGYCQVIYDLDRKAREQGEVPSKPWPQDYAYDLFEALGIVGAAALATARAVNARNCRRNLWTFTFDWVRETLSCLAAQGYRMSVISNSDGRTAEVFRDLGLAHYFEKIFDSALLGIEKPDPAIFELALRELNLRPADALYIGDVFEIDIRGANRAGLGGLHLDPLGLYADWPGVHLTDVRHLPDWLAWYAAISSAFDFFPTRRLDYATMSTSKTQGTFMWLRLRMGFELPTSASDGIRPFRPDPLRLRR